MKAEKEFPFVAKISKILVLDRKKAEQDQQD
jgi:hypothetical protein